MNHNNVINSFQRYALTILKLSMAITLLWSSGMIRYNIAGVPFTMQSMVVMLIALYHDKQSALQAVIAYALLSMFWMITATSAYPVGLTFGYILGFIPAVAWVQSQKHHFKEGSSLGRLSALVIGQVMIWLAGYIWLAQFVGYGHAVQIGILPFVITDAIKLCAILCFTELVSVSYANMD